jgi:uncharacterized protein YciI
MHRLRILTLVAVGGLLSGGGLCIAAQAASGPAGVGSYYVKLTAPPLSSPERLAVRQHSMIRSAAYWDNLYNVGKVTIVGATKDGSKDGSAGFGVVILEGVSQNEAISIANGDPSVKAGVTTAEVLPMQVFQTKNQRRPKTR